MNQIEIKKKLLKNAFTLMKQMADTKKRYMPPVFLDLIPLALSPNSNPLPSTSDASDEIKSDLEVEDMQWHLQRDKWNIEIKLKNISQSDFLLKTHFFSS